MPKSDKRFASYAARLTEVMAQVILSASKVRVPASAGRAALLGGGWIVFALMPYAASMRTSTLGGGVVIFSKSARTQLNGRTYSTSVGKHVYMLGLSRCCLVAERQPPTHTHFSLETPDTRHQARVTVCIVRTNVGVDSGEGRGLKETCRNQRLAAAYS